MRKFTSEVFSLGVLLGNTAEKEILSACEKAARKETGGILIGFYSNINRCAQIITATIPTIDSKQKFNLFVRGTKGIRTFLTQRWQDGQYYIGEWHYHPSGTPMPSNLDKFEIGKISKDEKTKCPEPVMLIIGGNRQVGWKYYVGVMIKGKLISLEET